MNITDTVETPVYLSLISFSSLSPLKQSLNNLVRTPCLFFIFVQRSHKPYAVLFSVILNFTQMYTILWPSPCN